MIACQLPRVESVCTIALSKNNCHFCACNGCLCCLCRFHNLPDSAFPASVEFSLEVLCDENTAE